MNPNVPEWTKVFAKLSDFSVMYARIAPRSWSRTARRGRRHAASTTAYGLAARHEAGCRTGFGAAARVSTHVRCQSSSISRHQSRWPWSARPATCSSRSRSSRCRRGAARAGACGRVEQEVCRELSQFAAEPRGQRHAEARLPARRDLVRAGRAANACRRATFPRRPASFSRSGSDMPSSSTRPVEERRAELERVRHRRDVGLHEQVAGEVACGCRAAAGPSIPGRAGAPSSSAADARARHELRLPELGAELRQGRPPSAARSARRAAPRPSPAGGPRGSPPNAARASGGGASAAAAAAPTPGQPGGEPVCGVALVAGERLVAAVARQRHRHVPRARPRRSRKSGSAASSPCGSSNASARRGSVVCDVGLEHDLLVLGRETLGDRVRVAPLVVARRRRSRP